MTARFFIIGLIMSFSIATVAQIDVSNEAPGRYAFLLYYGAMTCNTLGHVIKLNYSIDDEQLYSGEFTYVFRPDQGIRRYFGPVFQSIEANFNFTVHDDHGRSFYEFVPYLSFRWKKFPWTNYLKTSISLGEGVSWASNISTREWRDSKDPQKFLNYLNLEMTAALPSFPRLELVGRFHHRSGVFGLYRSTNSGSTAAGLAVRWYFDQLPT
jgi:hypothetical protein